MSLDYIDIRSLLILKHPVITYHLHPYLELDESLSGSIVHVREEYEDWLAPGQTMILLVIESYLGWVISDAKQMIDRNS